MSPASAVPLARVERAGLVLALGLAVSLMWPLRSYLTDDTFIHLQYARHLVQGQGLVFNPGERVYGCTSPLWVALLAAGMGLGLDGLRVAKAMGFLSTLVSVVLFLLLLRREVRAPGLRAAATVAWAGHAWMLRWSLSGMETPLAVALVLAGFVAWTAERESGARPARALALWALAALARPEAALLLALGGIAAVVDREGHADLRRRVVRVLPPLLLYGGWLLFAHAYFGNAWPQTLSAKSAGGDALAVQLANLWRQVRVLGATDGVTTALLLVALVAGPRGARGGRARGSDLLPWVWVGGVPVLYLIRGVPVLSRYLLLLTPVLAWLAWRAAETWWLGAGTDPARVRRVARWGVVTAALSLALNLSTYRMAVVPHVRDMTTTVRASLLHWGAWLRDHTPAEAVVATPDIGAVGWASGRRVLDTAGLVTPRMLPLLERAPVGDVDPRDAAVADLAFAAFARPEWLLERGERAGELRERSRFAAALVPVGATVAPTLGLARAGSTVYTLYRVRWEAYDSLTTRH